VKIVVYTAIIGNIDRLWSALPSGVQHVAFVDSAKHEAGLWGGTPPRILPSTGGISGPPTWEQRTVKVEGDTRRTSRHYKACPHRYLPDADVWVWVDGNVRLRIPAEAAVKRWLKGDFATLKHPQRGDLYAEAAACAKLGKDNKRTLSRQADRYRDAGHPAGWGLAETRIVIRRNTPAIRALNEAWWAEIEAGSVRDQVSLPFVAWQLGQRWDVIPGRCWGDGHSDLIHLRHRQ
jgi:hypothetical protein